MFAIIGFKYKKHFSHKCKNVLSHYILGLSMTYQMIHSMSINVWHIYWSIVSCLYLFIHLFLLIIFIILNYLSNDFFLPIHSLIKLIIYTDSSVHCWLEQGYCIKNTIKSIICSYGRKRNKNAFVICDLIDFRCLVTLWHKKSFHNQISHWDV